MKHNYIIFLGNLRHIAEASFCFERALTLQFNLRPIGTRKHEKGLIVAYPAMKDFNSFYEYALNSLKEIKYNGIIPRILVPSK